MVSANSSDYTRCLNTLSELSIMHRPGPPMVLSARSCTKDDTTGSIADGVLPFSSRKAFVMMIVGGLGLRATLN